MMPSGPPPMYAGPSGGPPPRQGRPWWVWLLVGCAVVFILGGIVLGGAMFYAYRIYKQAAADVGPVDEASMTRLLVDVPLYPGSTYQPDQVRPVLVMFRLAEKARKDRPGSIVSAVAISTTSDSPEKVREFYDKKMEELGYRRSQTGEKGSPAHAYEKTGAVIAITAVPDNSGRTKISIFRGGSSLVEHLGKATSSTPGAAAPEPRSSRTPDSEQPAASRSPAEAPSSSPAEATSPVPAEAASPESTEDPPESGRETEQPSPVPTVSTTPSESPSGGE